MNNNQTTDPQRTTIPLRLAAANDRREYGVQFIKAGPVRRRDGAHANWDISPEALSKGIKKLDGVAVFVDHAGWDYPSLKNLVAVTFGPSYNTNNQAIDGGIRLYSHADWLQTLFDEIIADAAAGKETPDVGLSIVFYGKHEYDDRTDKRVTIDLGHVESCDLVFGPAAEGRIKEILSMNGTDRYRVEPSIVQTQNFASQSQKGQHHMSEQQQANAANQPVGVSQQSVQTQDIAPQNPTINRQQAQANTVQTQNIASQDIASPEATPQLTNLLNNITQLGQIIEQDTREQQNAHIQLLAQRVDELSAALVAREEKRAVQGMGYAPNDKLLSVVSGKNEIDRYQDMVNWLFGVQGAERPDPMHQRADRIYWDLTGDYEFYGKFNRERVQLANANTTTLADLAVNAMNKVIATQFSALTFWRWFERITAVTPNDGSLHPMQWITFGGIGNLPTVAEGGTYTELDVDDVKEADSFVKKGGYVGITREMIKNSDIQRIQAIPRALAIAALRTRSAAVSSLFTSQSGTGPTLDQDTTVLFHANHSNIGTTAFSATEWGVVRTAVFKHAEVGSAKALGVFPKYALVPADLYDAALAAFGYGDGYPTTYNIFVEERHAEDPRPVPIVVPDWTDANDWAAITDPMIFPVIMMSYSQNPGGGGHPIPELFSVVSETAGLMFTNDTLPIKVRDEFAVGVNGYRGIYKENVT